MRSMTTHNNLLQLTQQSTLLFVHAAVAPLLHKIHYNRCAIEQGVISRKNMEMILELARPIGNAVAKYVFQNKLIEEDSILSDGIGLFTIVIMLIILAWLILKI